MTASTKTEDLKGRAKEAAGSLTNDTELKSEGRSDQARADVKERVNQVIDTVQDSIDWVQRNVDKLRGRAERKIDEIKS